MKHIILGLALTALVLAPTSTHASSPNKVAPDLGENEATSITVSLECTVVVVLPDNQIVLRDIESGLEKDFTLAPKVKLRTRDKKRFGRRKLKFSDLAAGQTVKITAYKHNGEITRIDVLKKTG